MSRRELFAVTTALAAGTALGVAGCTAGPVGSAASHRLTLPDPAATEPYRAAAKPLVMNIVAHPDDDFFFMNPDTFTTLRSGTPVVSVYVTAGESTGVNHAPFGPKHRHKHDLSGYSSARHQGLRQAYATMLGLPHFTPWKRDVITLAGGIHVETDTLAHGRMSARLVFLQVSMHEWSPTASLPMMWDRGGVPLPYIVAKGAPAPADRPAVWTHDKLVDALVQLMDRFRPTHIRTLDPDPDIQVHDKAHPTGSDQPGYSDHRDHTAAALFAWKAMDQWVGQAGRAGGIPPFTTAAYRGYYNQRWPKNLPPATVALKARFMYQYGGNGAWHCGNPAGCGDYGQGQNEPLSNRKGWIRSTHPRYPGTRLVFAPAPADPTATAKSRTRPRTTAPAPRTAFEVLGTRAMRHTETAKGLWGPPEDLGGGPLAPVLSCERAADGTILLFALRFASLDGQGGRNARDIVVWRENGGWQSLGNPEPDDDRGRRIGSPVTVRTPDGRVHLFVRNAARGVSTRVLGAGGAWSAWQDLGGGEVQEGLAVATDKAGLIHVFGSGHASLHHWVQRGSGGAVAPRPVKGLPLPGDFPSARRTKEGAVEVAYPLPASARTFRTTVR
ncbi:PIG-L family deacetylase [Actinacidiphila acididurans]|uniref:PIG-L family deacetylase n=1 Tax=Actinacidiphila acididurans TaxID=2784346 RepID=A0ABS2TPM7_9ACTN|nr:PIG-L family deacetylase [Actinacidiphila acididurans]MBM9504787.1 PIG-L family deacetylase [Actinacidiphila acididurans]